MNEQIITQKKYNFLSMLKKYEIIIAITLGILCSFYQLESLYPVADAISTVFMKLMKLISMPIIFLSIISTISGTKNMKTLQSMGSVVLRYTLLTTFIAAVVALVIFLIVQPTANFANITEGVVPTVVKQDESIINFLIDSLPDNIFKPFMDGNVVGVFLMALLVSFAILKLEEEQKETLHNIFNSMNSAMLKVGSFIIKFIPLAVWAFVVIFFKESDAVHSFNMLAKYLFCIVAANLIQALIILPLLLKANGISPFKTASNVVPALMTAFWSKSSSATLPVTMQCAEENLKLSPQVSRFSLSLCTTINMNACAAFILTTVLFLSTSYGITFSNAELISWVFIAVIAAVGNASVPMGCYFLACALLAYLNVPLHVMGIILPFYVLLDMLETAINVWSDICVTSITNKKIN